MSYAFTNMTLLSFHAHCSALVPDRPFKLSGRNAQSIFVILYVSDEGIKVRVTYPDNVSDTIRQQKINKMYDIFLGAMRRNGTEETTE